jgi:hypothetical protein
LLCIGGCENTRAQYPCNINQLAFKTNELLEYKVVYNWGLVWLESGYSSFSVNTINHNGRAAFHFKGQGATFPKYDWFYKVNDYFEAIVDSTTFHPLKFTATVNEGNKHDKHTYLFDHMRQRAFTVITRGTKKTQIDTLKIAPCTIDVLTAIYYARSLDYSKCKINDTIGMSLLIDGKVYPIYVRYLGKDKREVEDLGKFNCVKFSPLLVEGSIFKKGEGMTVWVSDDENKLPVYIETPIIVGTVKVTLTKYKGLKYPVSARIADETQGVKKGKKP